MGGWFQIAYFERQKPGISGEFANRVTEEVVVPK
jgi:hypothetical protein